MHFFKVRFIFGTIGVIQEQNYGWVTKHIKSMGQWPKLGIESPNNDLIRELLGNLGPFVRFWVFLRALF